MAAMEISTDMNTDIGGLKATLIARGDHRATYKDLENKDVYSCSDIPILSHEIGQWPVYPKWEEITIRQNIARLDMGITFRAGLQPR